MRFYARVRPPPALPERRASSIHLSKNPVFAGRVESLIEAFPDARIVVPIRNPYETIPSLLKLMKIGWRMRELERAAMQRSLRILADQSFHTYRYPLEVLARHPGDARTRSSTTASSSPTPQRAIEQRLRGRSASRSRRSPRAAPRSEEQSARSEHETAHRYSLEEFGLDGDAIRSELADLFERFHWDAGAPTPPPGTPPGGADG